MLFYTSHQKKQYIMWVMLSVLSFSVAAHGAILHIPMYSEQGTPIITLNIHGAAEKFVLDTGSREGLHLTKAMMSTIPNLKIESKWQESIDLAGTVRKNQTFTIPELKMGDITLHNVSGVELQAWGLSISAEPLADIPGQGLPVVGLGLLASHWVTIDSQNGLLTLSDEAWPDNNGWLELPYQLRNEGLALKLSNNKKNYSLILDSAATISLIKSEALPNGASLLSPEQAGWAELGNDYQFQPLYLPVSDVPVSYALVYDGLPKEFAPDGLLGMDFLDNFKLRFTLQEQRILVQPYSKQQ